MEDKIKKVWLTKIENCGYVYLIFGGGFKHTLSQNIAYEVASKIRAKHPELKYARIKSFKVLETRIDPGKLNVLLPENEPYLKSL